MAYVTRRKDRMEKERKIRGEPAKLVESKLKAEGEAPHESTVHDL